MIDQIKSMNIDRIFASFFDEDCFVFENDDISALRAAIGFHRHSGLSSAALITGEHASSKEIVEACERGSLSIMVVVISPDWEKTRSRLAALMDVSRWFFVPSFDSELPPLSAEAAALDTDYSLLNVFMGCAKRPVILLGKDIDTEEIPSILQKKLPITVTADSIDRIPEYHPLFVGRVGPDGDRNGNFVVQNADLILLLGETEALQTRRETFGREAHIVSVSNRSLFSHVFYNAPVSVFLQNWVAAINDPDPNWIPTCKRWKEQWGKDLPQIAIEDETMNPYHFQGIFHDMFQDTKTIIGRVGTPWWYPLYQQNQILPGDRFLPVRCKDVLPFALGCFLSSMEDTRDWIVFLDDDCLFRLQDLSAVVENEAPLKIFCMNHGDRPLLTDDEGYLQRNEDGDTTLQEVGEMLGVRVLSISDYADMDEIRECSDEVVLVDVACGKCKPFPIGRHDLPLEVMEPEAPHALLTEMIISPMPGYGDNI